MPGPHSSLIRCGLLPAALLLLSLAGCESDHFSDAGSHRGGRPRPALPPLAGQGDFFGGTITAELNTGSGFSSDGKADDAGSNHGRGGGGFHAGGGGGRRHGGGGGEGGYGGEPSVSDIIEHDQVANLRRAANGAPPIVIHLRFVNHGATPANLLVLDFLSPLGNFVVDPEKLSLAPGQSVEVEPMTSRVANGLSQAEVTLTLRLDGHSEKKTLLLSATTVPAASGLSGPAPGSGSVPEK